MMRKGGFESFNFGMWLWVVPTDFFRIAQDGIAVIKNRAI